LGSFVRIGEEAPKEGLQKPNILMEGKEMNKKEKM